MTAASDAHSGNVPTAVAPPQKWGLWVGRVLSALPVLMMGMSAVMKLAHTQQMAEMWVNKFKWPENLLTPIAVLELACALLYVIPRTAVLGAILVSSYLAAAFATHLRIGEAGGGAAPLVLATFAWAGLYLRDDRLRSLLPLRS